MIDIHIRISRKFILWIVVILAALFLLSLALTTLGRSSGSLKVGPTQTTH
jgi:hypothetical protein